MINAVHKYVIYDDVNYIKGGWVNRNRILIEGESHFINLPISHASPNKLILDIDLSNDINRKRKMLTTLKMCYSRAPYFDNIIPLLQNIILYNESNLAKYLENSIRSICSYLNITTEILVSSNLVKNNELRGKEKVYDICKLLDADTYYNAIGGQSLYDKSEFKTKGFELRFLRTNEIIYKQFKNEFVPNLSIIDVLMFNPKDEVIRLLDSFTLE